MVQSFAGHEIGPSDPGSDIVPITPNDSADLAVPVRAMRANTAGTIQVTMYGASGAGVVRVLNFLAGETRVGEFVRVWATNTTVTGIEGHV